jgi:hypothetical protein
VSAITNSAPSASTSLPAVAGLAAAQRVEHGAVQHDALLVHPARWRAFGQRGVLAEQFFGHVDEVSVMGRRAACEHRLQRRADARRYRHALARARTSRPAGTPLSASACSTTGAVAASRRLGGVRSHWISVGPAPGSSAAVVAHQDRHDSGPAACRARPGPASPGVGREA